MPGAGGVESELADRDAHAVGAEIAEPEDALAVGDDDHAHVVLGPVAQHVRDLPAVFRRHEHPVRPPEDVPELLARLPHRRRVDDRHHLLEVVEQDPVEQGLVAVLQAREDDVLAEVGVLAVEIVEHAQLLLPLRADARRQEPAQRQGVAFGQRERRALVQMRVTDQVHAGAGVPGTIQDVRIGGHRARAHRARSAGVAPNCPTTEPPRGARATGRIAASGGAPAGVVTPTSAAPRGGCEPRQIRARRRRDDGKTDPT